jgi:hypothetical protein
MEPNLAKSSYGWSPFQLHDKLKKQPHDSNKFNFLIKKMDFIVSNTKEKNRPSSLNNGYFHAKGQL